MSSAESLWWEIHLACTDTDEAAAICHAAGASLIETLSDKMVRAFVEGDAGNFVSSLPATLTVAKKIAVENKNWHESCPELWASKRIGALNIVPTSGVENSPIPAADEVLIIPGTGFGTGHHPATAMLIARIQEISPAPKTVLDLGCGSGILALVARKVWPTADIIAIDNDPLALENARDNNEINKIDIPLICGTLDDAPLPKYELIIANLYSSLLIQLEPQMKSRCSRLILSGVMESEENTLLEAFSGWKIISTRIQDGWFSAELRA